MNIIKVRYRCLPRSFANHRGGRAAIPNDDPETVRLRIESAVLKMCTQELEAHYEHMRRGRSFYNNQLPSLW